MARKYRKKPIPYCGGKEIADEAACVVKRLFHFMKSNYPSLIESINYLEPFAVQENLHGFATDGKHLFYHPQWVCKRRYSVEMLEKRILHIIIHGLLGHFERYMRHEKKTLFSKVMDVQALVLMSELNRKPSLADHHVKFIRQEFTDEMGDSLYYKALRDRKVYDQIKKALMAWKMEEGEDDHAYWAYRYAPNDVVPMDRNCGVAWKKLRNSLLGAKQVRSGMELFSQIAEAIQKNGKTAEHGSGEGEEETIASAQEEPLCYRDLLSELQKVQETVREQDRIDPILYTYGLELYGDVPLIEPPEIGDNNCFHSVVVAVDTSGSCWSSMNVFWSETCGLFRDIGEIGSLEYLHFLECDAEIKGEETFSEVWQMQECPVNRAFHGCGGTDFRPVFSRIEAYQRENEIIDCLIYFSDGCGGFPEKEPDYPVFFVFPSKEYYSMGEEFCPKWVRRVLLENDFQAQMALGMR